LKICISMDLRVICNGLKVQYYVISPRYDCLQFKNSWKMCNILDGWVNFSNDNNFYCNVWKLKLNVVYSCHHRFVLYIHHLQYSDISISQSLKHFRINPNMHINRWQKYSNIVQTNFNFCISMYYQCRTYFSVRIFKIRNTLKLNARNCLD
jgi:hypothetical protein